MRGEQSTHDHYEKNIRVAIGLFAFTVVPMWIDSLSS